MLPEKFTLTEQHVVLLRAANVRWDESEFGAPAIDSKRPYGNSDVIEDLGELLGYGPEPERGYPDDVAATLNRLHRETETALQVVLATGQFTPGHYAAPYTKDWRPVGDPAHEG